MRHTGPPWQVHYFRRIEGPRAPFAPSQSSVSTTLGIYSRACRIWPPRPSKQGGGMSMLLQLPLEAGDAGKQGHAHCPCAQQQKCRAKRHRAVAQRFWGADCSETVTDHHTSGGSWCGVHFITQPNTARKTDRSRSKLVRRSVSTKVGQLGLTLKICILVVKS